MNEVVCQAGVGLLMDYTDRVLPGDVRATLETHVAGCPKCAAFVASYLATPRIVREATAPAMPETLQSALLARLRQERSH